MLDEQMMDWGAVHMHKKVIGDIAAAALREIPGVSLARFGLLGPVCEILGYKNYPGVSVRLDKDGQVVLNMRVVVEFGLNIPATASHIQDAVRAAVEKAVDIDLREININIQSVDRKES